MARRTKHLPLKIVNNILVRDPNGDLLFRHEFETAKDCDCATIRKVKNRNPDSNEADEYTLIECSDFQLQLTPKNMEDLQARYGKKPHEPKPKAAPKLKKAAAKKKPSLKKKKAN